MAKFFVLGYVAHNLISIWLLEGDFIKLRATVIFMFDDDVNGACSIETKRGKGVVETKLLLTRTM